MDELISGICGNSLENVIDENPSRRNGHKMHLGRDVVFGNRGGPVASTVGVLNFSQVRFRASMVHGLLILHVS